MTARTYRLIVRDAPASVNAGGGGSRRHHQVGGREKRRWEDLYLAEMMVARVAPGMTYCAVYVTVHFRRRHHRDEENFRHPAVKPLGDALQQGGYLPDDTREFFRVADFKLIEKSEPWPFLLLDGYTEVRLEALYG